MRRMHLLLIILLFVVHAGGFEFDSPWNSGGRAISSALEIPPDPTYYNIASFDNWIPSGGAQIFLVFPRRPLNAEIDTTWEGIVRPQFILSSRYDVDTVFTEDATTGASLELIPVNEEMGMALIRAEGEGYFSVRATDFYSAMKPSIPMLFEVKPSGTEATRWGIFGFDVVLHEDHFTPHWAAAIDDSGRVVPSYMPGLTMDYVTVAVVGESNPDSSAGIMNLVTMAPSPEAVLPIIYGMAPFYIWDTESETIKVVAYAADTLAISDTIEIFIAPEGDAPFLMTSTFESMRVSQDQNTNVYAMAFTGSDLDPTNNSTLVRLSPIDLTGAESAVIDPFDWRRLTGGMVGFSFLDTEPDTLCVFISAETDSIPKLETPFYSPLQVVPPNIALKFEYNGPNLIIVGDTIKLVVEAINGLGEIDTSLEAFFTVEFWDDYDSSATVIDSASGTAWNVNRTEETVLHMTKGRYALYLTNTMPETLYFVARDAELVGLFDQGLIGFVHEHEIVFEEGDSGGAPQYRFALSDMGMYPAGEWCEVTITARTGAGLIDASYDGTAVVLLGGFGITDPPAGITDFDNGIATISVRNDSSEMADVEVSGPLLPDHAMIMFLERGSGGVLFPFDFPDWFPIGTSRNIMVGIMNIDGISVTWDGAADISVIDPNDNGSISAPDSVIIIGGLGNFAISNIDAERFTLTADTGGDEGYFDLSIESRALLNAVLPCSCEVAAILDSIIFSVTDTAFNLFAYSCTVEIEIVESNPNGSVSYNSEAYIAGGYGVAVLENTENETLSVYVTIPDNQFLYMDMTPVAEWNYLAGEIVYFVSAIGESNLPLEFDLSRVIPNPFNPSFTVNVAVPEKGRVKIEMFDITGKKVMELLNEQLSAGTHELKFNVSDRPSGIYMLRAVFGDNTLTRKAVLLK